MNFEMQGNEGGERIFNVCGAFLPLTEDMLLDLEAMPLLERGTLVNRFSLMMNTVHA